MTMSTRALVPRADGEGSLGVKTKRWGDIQSHRLNNLIIPNEPTIDDAYKVLRINGDVTEFEYVTAFLPDITEEDAGKILTAIGYNTAAWTEYPTVNFATTDIAGTVKVGSGLNIELDGTLSVPIATTDIAGVVKIGENLNIETDGTVSIPTATSTTKGVSKVGRSLSINDGILDVDQEVRDNNTIEMILVFGS